MSTSPYRMRGCGSRRRKCKLCGVNLPGGEPVTPCYRRECGFGQDEQWPDASDIASTLNGEDYSSIH